MGRIDQLEDGKAWEICRARVLEPLLAYNQAKPPQASSCNRSGSNDRAGCKDCKQLLSYSKKEYSKTIWKKWLKKKQQPTCKACVDKVKKATEEHRVCPVCVKPKPKRAYSNTQWDQKTKYIGCKACRCLTCKGYGLEFNSDRQPIYNTECQTCKGTGINPSVTHEHKSHKQSSTKTISP